MRTEDECLGCRHICAMVVSSSNGVDKGMLGCTNRNVFTSKQYKVMETTIPFCRLCNDFEFGDEDEEDGIIKRY